MKHLGLIGMGLLGAAVAERLLKAGYPITGFDQNPDRCCEAIALGVERAGGGPEVAANCELLLTCLPDGPAVHAALFDQGTALCLSPGTVLVDLTTCAPSEAQTLAARLSEQSVPVLDAPISGSSAAVRQGEGLMMVGGTEEAFQQCREVLHAIAPRVFHVGANGAGATAKLVSNLVLGLNRLALAEGLVLAERTGLNPETTLHLLRESAAYSRAMDAKGERMIHRRYDPEARLRQHLKDVDLIRELGREHGLPLPLSALHHYLLTTAASLGYADADNAAIIEALRPLD